MAKKILVFSSLFLFLISSSFSAGDTFISIIYGYTPLNFSDFNTNAESLNSLFSYWYDKFSPYGMTEKSGEFGRLSNAHSFESEASINNGILYYYNNHELAPETDPLPMLIYAEEKPVGLDGLREARLNLNGWTLLVGLRFWF